MIDNNRLDIMVDIETLGKQLDSTIFQIAIGFFNIQTGEIYETFNYLADISKMKCNVDGDTLQWWLQTNPELLNVLINGNSNLSENNIIEKFYMLIKTQIGLRGEENIFLWGNGILFDNAMIKAHMKSCGLKYPIFYRNDRDMRTLIELAVKKLNDDNIRTEKDFRDKYFDKSKYVEHNAVDDVRFQIGVVCKAYNILMD